MEEQLKSHDNLKYEIELNIDKLMDQLKYLFKN